MAQSRSGGTVEEVTGKNGKPKEEPDTSKQTEGIALPELPTAKTTSSGELEEKMTVIFGPPGVGKSTLASQWAGGDGLFLNTAGELGELEVFQWHTPSWDDFRLQCASIVTKHEAGEFPHPSVCIDTSDVLGKYCADKVRAKLGIAHESDLEWGKGWSSLRDEWQLRIAKLSAIPNVGVVHVTHSTEIEVKTRSASWHKSIFRGVKGVRETMLDMADIVLFISFAQDDDSKRVINTKPSRFFDAKERGQRPRLPAEIEWPLGSNGWDIIKAAWTEGGKS